MKRLMAAVLMVVSLQANAWQYGGADDKMRGTKQSWAYLYSENKVNFDFPYHGGSNLKIFLRKNQRQGSDAMLIINKGQFMCSMGCSVHVKFDGGKIERYEASGTADGSMDMIFITSYKKFLSKLRKSNKVFIEADFYNAGSRQFEFSPAGLDWD